MAGKYLLGIDDGGTLAKAALFSVDGRELAVASNKADTLSPNPGWCEFDMHRLWEATAASVRRVIADSKIDPREILAVACTGHGNGIYLVDAEGTPVRNAIYSADSRASEYIAKWAAAGLDKAVRPKTMQALWPGQPNALLAWLRDNEPEAIAKARWVLMCKDYIRLRLTGEARAELTDMSGTSLMNVATADYDLEILQAFGIAEMIDKLPPLCLSADVCGDVTTEAAAQTGLAEGTPVAGGMFDIDACGLSSALIEESQLGMVLGTWGINQYVSRTPVTSDAVFMTSRYCIPDYYLMLEGSPTSAGNLEWFLAEFFGAEALTAKQRGESIYDLVNRWVAETKPQDSGMIFLPFLYGSNVGAEASATLVGISDRDNRGHVLRAIYEGVAFAHMTHWERLLKVRAMPERICASGGAARSDPWMQILADVCQVPVEIPDGTELGALGAAICAGVAVGCYESYQAACQAMVRFPRCFHPTSGLAGLYQRKYGRYKAVLKAMEDTWSDLAWVRE